MSSQGEDVDDIRGRDSRELVQDGFESDTDCARDVIVVQLCAISGRRSSEFIRQ